MTTSTKTAKGFAVTCTKCHAEGAILSIDLNNLNEVTCSECGNTYSAREACDMAAAELARWEAVVRWVEMASEAMASAE